MRVWAYLITLTPRLRPITSPSAPRVFTFSCAFNSPFRSYCKIIVNIIGLKVNRFVPMICINRTFRFSKRAFFVPMTVFCFINHTFHTNFFCSPGSNLLFFGPSLLSRMRLIAHREKVFFWTDVHKHNRNKRILTSSKTNQRTSIYFHNIYILPYSHSFTSCNGHFG